MNTILNATFRISILLLIILITIAATCQWVIHNKSFGFSESEHVQHLQGIETSNDIEQLRKYANASSRASYSGGELVVSILQIAKHISIFLVVIVFWLCWLAFKAKQNISNKALQSDAAEPRR